MAAENRSQSTAVAVIAPPRLPYHPVVEERFGVDKSMWKALVESVFPNAKSPDAIILALSYCKARRLDVFKRPVHIVPIWDNNQRREVETVWPGIAEHRTTAMRTGNYAGLDAPRFGPDVTHTFSGDVGRGDSARKITIDVTFPAWCEITVYRMVQGARVPFPGPRVNWLEYYSARGKSGVPNDRWTRAPVQMLEKCAEAAALRRAFPEEIGDEWTAEEVGGAAASPAMRDITPTDAPPEPTREQFQEPTQPTTDASEAHDEVRTDDDAPNGWELFDHTGEQIGEYGITEWIGAYDASQPKPNMKRERTIYAQNNADSAKAIHVDSDTPDALRKQLVERFPGLGQDLLAGAK